MTLRKSAFMVLWLGLLLVAVAAGTASAKTITLKRKTSVACNLGVFSYDGLATASVCNGTGNGTLGASTVHSVVEWKVVSPTTLCTVPGGGSNAGIEFTLVGSNGVSIYSDGSQLFEQGTSGELCHDSVSEALPISASTTTSTITGGTGKYAGASGSTQSSSSGRSLAKPAPGGDFSASTGTHTGTLVLP